MFILLTVRWFERAERLVKQRERGLATSRS
jgi:hypothetical protein